MSVSKDNKRCLGVIPVRLESNRLPNKPLKDIAGKTLVQRVWEQATKCKTLDLVVVATNSNEIERVCREFGAKVVMTGSHHETGTDRVAEVGEVFEGEGRNYDVIANIQGDMPFINPKVIDSTVSNLLTAPPDRGLSTIATPITTQAEFERPASVKVVIGEDGRALYFSRSPIPYWRTPPAEGEISESCPYGYKHMGLYVYRRSTLTRLASFKRSGCEAREGLEQLRALAHGINISVNILTREMVEPSIEVDTPEDLARAIQYAETVK